MIEYNNLKVITGVIYQANEDGMMIYVPEEGMIHAVNITAADILLLIEQGNKGIDQLVDAMKEKYVGVDREVLHDDVKAILDTYIELDIISNV